MPPDPHPEHQQWRDDLIKISSRLGNLMGDRTAFEHVRTMVGRNSDLNPHQGQFPARLARWYVNHICVGIRTLVDIDPRTISLYRLLTELIDRPAALASVSPTGRKVSVEEIENDRTALKNVSQRVTHMVNTEIGHMDRKGYQKLAWPTFQEVTDCLAESEKVLQKYWSLVFATHLVSAEPVDTLDWTQQFRFAWYTPPPTAT